MRIAFHTSCNEAYLPGLEVLVAGIRRSMPDVDIVVTSRDIKAVKGCNIVHPAPILNDIREYDRWNRALWYYMNAAALTEYDRVIMVGCDQLIVGDLTQVVKNPPEFGALVEVGKEGAKLYNGRAPAFCTGMMIITPGDLSELVSIANEREWPLSEQTVWNEWAFRNNVDVKQLPEHYDLMRRSFVHFPDRWNKIKGEAVSIHYVGPDKPWMGPPQDKRYAPLWDLWKSYADGKPIEVPEA